ARTPTAPRTLAHENTPQPFAQGEAHRGSNVRGPPDPGVGPTRTTTPRQRPAEPAKGEARKGAEVARRPFPIRAGLGQPVMSSLMDDPQYSIVKASSEAFPAPLNPVDDLPPATVITHVLAAEAGRLIARGTTSDGGVVKRVSVNGQEARALRPDFAEWEMIMAAPEGSLELIASAEDAAGNVEMRPHRATIRR